MISKSLAYFYFIFKEWHLGLIIETEHKDMSEPENNQEIDSIEERVVNKYLIILIYI